MGVTGYWLPFTHIFYCNETYTDTHMPTILLIVMGEDSSH
jgi:hypothetical protein